MEFAHTPTDLTSGTVLCCQCGISITPNPANMCVACIRTQVDITEGIPKQGTLYFCRNCERYLQPPSMWIQAALESRELLSVCLKKLKGLKEVRLVDAGFVWTEPHSKRIKVKLTIQKEVLSGAVLQQVFVVEFVINNQMCDDCHRVEAKDFWKALVQVRQKSTHKKIFFYLEQLILKHKAHANTLSIKEMHEGLDFFFAQKGDARKMVDFLNTVLPCRYKASQKLISHDVHNNTYNYKDTFAVEIVPLCKDSIVCLPPKLAQQLGNLSQICVVKRITQTIHLIDPQTTQVAELSGSQFWRHPFNSICMPKQLVEYVVMDVEITREKERRHVAGHGMQSQRHVLADVWVAKSSEMATSDQQYHCRTHIGHLLMPGDLVMGFDMRSTNVNDVHFEKLSVDRLPDVVLVKKSYADRAKRNRKRKWKLHHLEKEDAASLDSADKDYTDFLEDLEEDPDFRQNVNIYKDNAKVTVETDDSTDEEDLPQISLQEMLEDLHISHDATGEEGSAMME